MLERLAFVFQRKFLLWFNLSSAVNFLVRCDNLTQRRGERGDFRTNEHDTQCPAVTIMVDEPLEIQVAVTCQSHRPFFSSLRSLRLCVIFN